MAGRGPAPKALEQRRNHHDPIRGDWTVLPPLKRRALPTLPKREGGWSERTKRAWEAWGKDPATGMFGPSELQAAVDMVYLYERWVETESLEAAKEVRQRLDGLGLSLKGKQDRRWRVTMDAPAKEDADAEVVVLRPVS